jgi:hypothetical protein
MFKPICKLCRLMFSRHFKSFSYIIVVRNEHDIPHLNFYLFVATATSKLVCLCSFFSPILQNMDYVVSYNGMTDEVERIWKEAVMV